MIGYLIIIAILWSFHDSVKKDQFQSSIFKRFEGSNFWDIQTAEFKYHNLSIFLYPYVMIGDAWHLSKTLILCTIFAAFYFGVGPYEGNIFVHYLFSFGLYAIFFEGSRMIFMGENYKLK
jgi:hypothetical protein